MATIQEIYDKLKSLDMWDIALDIMAENADYITELNREQLMDGRTSKGTDIKPLITQDSHFKKEGGAENYIARKRAKGTVVSRNNAIPSMKFSTGELVYNRLYAVKRGDYMEVGASGKGGNFDAKWKDIYGLNDDSMEKLIKRIQPELIKRIKQKLS